MLKIQLEHIKDLDEKRFIKSFSEHYNRSEAQQRALFTDFYNREWVQEIIAKYCGKIYLDQIQLIGGYSDAERVIVGCSPYDIEAYEWPICCLKIEVKTGIGKALSHRDYLGALLGLGIERDIIGDIIIKPFGAYVMIKHSMLDYIRFNLTSIGRYQNIHLTEIAFEEMEIEPPKVKVMEITVASMRLDVIVSAGFGLARSASLKLIKAEKVKCNGMNVSSSYLTKAGDVVTLRGYGKIKIGATSGLTKKDRLRITIEKYI